MTVAELIESLSRFAPDDTVLVLDNITYREPKISRISGAEYGIFPKGVPKIAIVPDRQVHSSV